MELESESINAYLAIMVRQCNRHNSAKAAFIDSFSMTAIWKRKAPRLKIKPMEHEVILGIVNEHHHWTLVKRSRCILIHSEKLNKVSKIVWNQQGHSCEKKDATSQDGLVTQSNTQNNWTLPHVESLH
ncbi:uncharacterized protein LOC109194822 isoform X2 [Oreochromis niloticus]|uniref:uncharacterized protein LOC109194822 isoform X2 n=1 Tax=Oreochromis niloticus TaxID=8128 RepID=UPI0009048DFC|nr:uncharacterized protein LOC109194822 isoform X2 [Oreochromis niloticus]XP_019201228.1 uncharacterized protein LOC109194822 isoform X2 [Oreochromis niloticus]